MTFSKDHKSDTFRKGLFQLSCMLIIVITAAWYSAPHPVPLAPEEGRSVIPFDLPPAGDKTELLNTAHSKLLQRAPWGKKILAAQQAEDNRWQMVGIVADNGGKFALISSNNSVRRYSLGSVLPGGEILQAIGKDQIEVSVDERKKIIRLYWGISG